MWSNDKLYTKALGEMEANCHIMVNKESGRAVIIDPGAEAGVIKDALCREAWTPAAILLTHGHYDHIMGAEAIGEKYGIPIYASEEERELMGNPRQNLSAYFSKPYAMEARQWVKDKDHLQLAGFEIEVIATPGHTRGSVCYHFYQEHMVFTGDTLFSMGVGRTDFPTGNASDLLESIQKKLFGLPGDVLVCPGHGENTTIDMQMRCNPYCRLT